MDKDTQDTFEKQADIVMNVVMRLSALEKLLLDKEMITKDELAAELEKIGEHVGTMINDAIAEAVKESQS